MVGVYIVAAAAFTAIGFGATNLAHNQAGSASASSAIPAPPAANQMFVEDDDGTGADSQAFILQSVVPGLVRIASAKGSGSGVVLTQSGLVLTSAQIVSSKGTITAKVLPSGHAYTAKVVGSDPAHDLTLLQLMGGSAFKPVAVGNSKDFAAGAATTAVSTITNGKAFTLAIGNVNSTNAATSIAGHDLTGLLQTTSQVFPGQSAGGPLVNLSGQVIGIDLAGSAHGVDITSYALPINEALAIAQRLKH